MAVIDGILGELEDAPTLAEPEKEPATEKSTLELLDDVVKQQKRIELGSSLTQAIDVNPDEHAEAAELSKTVGLPPDLVRQDLPAARKQAKQSKINYDLLMDKNQKLADAMSDPEFAKLAHDDFEPLQAIENVFKAQWEGLQKGQAVNQLGRLGSEEAFGKLSEEEQKRSLELQERMKDFQEYDGLAFVANSTAEIVGQMVDSFAHTFVKTAKGSVIGQAIEGEIDTDELLVSMAPGGPIANYLRDIFDIESGHFFLDVKDQADKDGNKIDPELAKGGAMAVGTVNAALEMLGLGFIGKPIASGVRKLVSETTQEVLKRATVSTAAKSFLKAYGTAWAGETITEVAQENVNMSVENLIKDMSEGEFEQIDIDERLARSVDIFKKVGTGMAVLALPGASVNFASDIQNVQTAKRNQEVMEALGDSAQASKLKERSPEKFQKFIDEVMKDGPVENVYIPVEKFDEYFQTAEIDMEQLLEELPSVKEQIAQARERGADIEIPINEYAAKIAPTEHHAGLMQDVKFDPSELTPREAAQMQEDLPAMFEAYMAEAQERIEGASTEQEAFDQIYEAMREQLTQAGESPVISANQAALIPHVFKAIQERYGFDAMTEFQRRNISVQSHLPMQMRVPDKLDEFIDRVRFSKAPKQQELYGKSLVEMLADRGGLIDEGGELTARDAHKWHLGRGRRKFVSEEGMSLDGAREIAIGEGYLPEGADLDDLLALIDQELAGDPVYSEQNIDRASVEIQEENQALIDFLASKGIDFAKATNQEIRDALNGVEPVTIAEVPAAEGKIATYLPDGTRVDLDVVAESEAGSIIVRTPEGTEEVLGDQYDTKNPQDPGFTIETIDESPAVSSLTDEQLEAAKIRLEEKIGAQAGQGGTSSLSFIRERNAIIFEQKRRTRLATVDGIEYNQQGELITDSEAFRKWFGDSKVVDEDGNPLVVYHGTPQEKAIDAFSGGSKWQRVSGIYFAPSAKEASKYTKKEGEMRGAVYPVYLSLRNPATRSVLDEIGYGLDGNEVRAELERRGYDGVMDEYMGEYIAFHPEQIKSTMNMGDFDPTDPRILYQEEKPATLPGIDLEEITDEEAIQKILDKYQNAFTQAHARGISESTTDIRTVSGRQARPGFLSETSASDDRGRPLQLHRGAALALSPEHFEREALGKASGYAPAGLGVWLSTDADIASGYGVVEQFHVDIRNPAKFTPDTLPEYDTIDEYYEFRESLREKGHDGVVIDLRDIGGGMQFVAFDADQVIMPSRAVPAVPLEEITVEVPAVEAETGREMKIQEQADVALQEIDESIEKLEAILKCLES